MSIPLDRIDLRILDVLQQRGRISNQDLADAVALTPSPCLRRVRRLEESGVIRRYVALLDAQSIGLGVRAYVSVKLEKRAAARGGRLAFDDFRDAVAGWPEVVTCDSTTGDGDYLMLVLATDLAHFSRFVMDTVLAYPAVLDVRSSFALERIKDTTAVPLPMPGDPH